eukprot:11158611-Lingulodinium_polyedra.AAC.1
MATAAIARLFTGDICLQSSKKGSAIAHDLKSRVPPRKPPAVCATKIGLLALSKFSCVSILPVGCASTNYR